MDNKLLYINIDGFSYSYLEQLQRYFPDGPFSKLVHKGLLFTQLRSGIVSITNPMQSAILCGAWSNRTHNFYQHYDWENACVIKHRRTCDAENVAQLFLRSGKTVASIHQFMLENNPCMEGVKDRAYIKCPQEKSNAFQRLAILKDMIQGKPVASGDQTFGFETLPDFTAVYIDDIDSLGHNNSYEIYPKRADFSQRQRDIMERLNQIGQCLLDIVQCSRETEQFRNLTILITTDHGMTPFFGKSDLPDIVRHLNEAGISASLPENRTEHTRVVALSYTIEVSLYCAPDITEHEKETIERVCQELPYLQRYFGKAEMEEEYGFDPRGPEFLLSPQYGKHFYHRDIEKNTFAASHDSFHETSQHIFGLLLDGSIPANTLYAENTAVIDLIPAITEEKFGLVLNPERRELRQDLRRLFAEKKVPGF